MVIVRHPLARLVSAYYDKMVSTRWNNYRKLVYVALKNKNNTTELLTSQKIQVNAAHVPPR